MKDDWVEVSEFPQYEIHKENGIRRKGKEKSLKGRTWFGYPKVTLMKDGKKHERRVHKLVAEHFLPNPGGKPMVNHMDSNRGNHGINNLEWVDNSENQLHRWKTQKEGLSKMKYEKEYNGLSKVALESMNDPDGYSRQLKSFIEKMMVDEISAAIFYSRAAQEITGLGGKDISRELETHSNEEKGHFDKLMAYAASHDFLTSINFRIDDSVANFKVDSDVRVVMTKVQQLEKDAIRDYKYMANVAKKNGDLEAYELFEDIMSDEIGHFDDLAYINGDKRELMKVAGLSALSKEADFARSGPMDFTTPGYTPPEKKNGLGSLSKNRKGLASKRAGMTSSSRKAVMAEAAKQGAKSKYSHLGKVRGGLNAIASKFIKNPILF